MHPESITHEEATKFLNELAHSGRTVYFSLVFGNFAAIAQVWGKLKVSSRGLYFISSDTLNCVLSLDRYSEVYRREEIDAITLGFAKPSSSPDLLIDVLLTVGKNEELSESTLLEASDAANWVH